jgi:hypothetical protein
MTPDGSRSGGGGSSAQVGFHFQNCAAAWVAVRILAERAASPPWTLAADTVLEFIRCETEQPVDDLLIGTSRGGFVFVQVKHTLTCESREHSPLSSTFDQFVRQFVQNRAQVSGSPWERPLDADRDRLVLLVGPGSSASIREHLPSALAKLKTVANRMVDTALLNGRERKAYSVARHHIERSWEGVTGTELSDDDLWHLLSMVRVHVLDVDAGGLAELEAKDLLRMAVLSDPESAGVAWNTLVQACAGLARDRQGADRAVLQKTLLNAGLHLQSTRSYHNDIQRLEQYSRRSVAILRDLSRICVGEREVKIHRPSTVALRDAAEEGSLLVVGEPGAGKSGALHDLALVLHEDGHDVVFLAVDRLEARSFGALGREIGVSYALPDILANWHSPQPAFLIIDALDAARSDRSVQAYRDLISELVRAGGRWRVIASIRKFDLRYSTRLRQLFSGAPPTEYRDVEFPTVRHIDIPTLQPEELGQVQEQSEELSELVRMAEPGLQELLRIPFNLRLAGELLGEGITVEELTPIRTQIDLLDRYWSERIRREDGQGDARESVLRIVAEGMVEARTLRVDRTLVATDATLSSPMHALLSSNILSEWQPSPAAQPEGYILTFAHHVLFDYAVARLLLRGTTDNVVRRLAAQPELVLAIRPSLLLHFEHMWFADSGRQRFWQLVFSVIETEGIPEIGKLIGPGVAAELATRVEDFEPLLALLNDPAGHGCDVAGSALAHVVGALVARSPESGRPLVGEGAGPWCELLERVSRVLTASVEYPVRVLLSAVSDQSSILTDEQRTNAGSAARRFLDFAWSDATRNRWSVHFALQAVCRTFGSDSQASATLVRRCLEPERIREYGFEEIPRLAREVGHLIPFAPDLVEDIYRVAFTYREVSDAATSMGSTIVNMISTRRQDYGLALYRLAEVFARFLLQAPVHGVSALVAALESYVAQRQASESDAATEVCFDFNGCYRPFSLIEMGPIPAK